VVHQPIECRVLFPCLLIEVRYGEDSLRVIAVTDQHVFIGGDRRARESDIGFGFDAFMVLDADRAGDEKRCDHFGWVQFGGPFKAAPGLGVILGQKRPSASSWRAAARASSDRARGSANLKGVIMDASATDGMAFWTRPLHSAFSPLLSTGGNAFRGSPKRRDAMEALTRRPPGK
jgi:hypothetical protein